MKRILALTAGIVFTLAAMPSMHGMTSACGVAFTPPAHAQAVDHDAIMETLKGMKQDINLMLQLVEKHKAGTVAIGDETVTLSAAQKTQIITRYNAIKAGLAAKYQTLP